MYIFTLSTHKGNYLRTKSWPVNCEKKTFCHAHCNLHHLLCQITITSSLRLIPDFFLTLHFFLEPASFEFSSSTLFIQACMIRRIFPPLKPTEFTNQGVGQGILEKWISILFCHAFVFLGVIVRIDGILVSS